MVETMTNKYPISIQKIAFSRINEVDFNDIPFGRVFSDHMLAADYSEGHWEGVKIQPFGNISISPTISALHYGQAIFEGMKAYKTVDGRTVIFRPEMNFNRMNYSARRMAMAEIPEEIFMGGLKSLLDIDRKWIPDTDGSSLYIRPFMFATEEYVGVRPGTRFRFMIFTCPVGQYYGHPVKVKVSDHYVRAFPGGVGAAKAAGNYGATMLPVHEAQEEGFDQLLWVNPKDYNTIQEIGTMNVFFHIGDKVITPSLENEDILDGVTRDSCITLVKEMGITLEERKITFTEVYEAHKTGQLKDAFGTGTAATIAHISEFGYHDEILTLPPVEQREISNTIQRRLNNIKLGIDGDKYNWLMEV